MRISDWSSDVCSSDLPECLIYRKDLLAAAGIAVPATWDDFHAAARALHAPDRDQYGTVLALFPDGHNSFYDFCIHIWSRGGEPFTADGRPAFTSPQAHQALDFLRMLAADIKAMAPGARDLDSVKSGRSEERRGGKECVSTCRSRWSAYY